MSGPRRRTVETWLSELEARLPQPKPEPLPPEVASAFHDAALAVYDRTGSARLARRAGQLWAAGPSPRPRLAVGGELTAEGREALERLLVELGWEPAGPTGPDDPH